MPKAIETRAHSAPPVHPGIEVQGELDDRSIDAIADFLLAIVTTKKTNQAEGAHASNGQAPQPHMEPGQ